MVRTSSSIRRDMQDRTRRRHLDSRSSNHRRLCVETTEVEELIRAAEAFESDTGYRGKGRSDSRVVEKGEEVRSEKGEVKKE